MGFSGVAELVRIRGGTAEVLRDNHALDTDSLVILTPGVETPPEKLAAILKRRRGLPTLIVLPKWAVRPIDASPPGSRRSGRSRRCSRSSRSATSPRSRSATGARACSARSGATGCTR
ncbi:MAG: hypothetical protein WDN24_01890 [Sphingomonas sp.]